MNRFNIGDRVMWNDKLCRVTYVYTDGTVKLQSVRGKSQCIYFRVPTDNIRKEDDKNG